MYELNEFRFREETFGTKLKEIINQMPNATWKERRRELLKRYLRVAKAIQDYREKIENTPLDQKLEYKAVAEEIIKKNPELTPYQKKCIKIRICRAIKVREKIRKYKDLPKRTLFIRAFGRKPESYVKLNEERRSLLSIEEKLIRTIFMQRIGKKNVEKFYDVIATPYAFFFELDPIVFGKWTLPTLGRYHVWRGTSKKLDGIIAMGKRSKISKEIRRHEIEHAHTANVIRIYDCNFVKKREDYDYAYLQNELISYISISENNKISKNIFEYYIKKIALSRKKEMEMELQRTIQNLKREEEKLKYFQENKAEPKIIEMLERPVKALSALKKRLEEQLKDPNLLKKIEDKYRKVVLDAWDSAENAATIMPREIILNLLGTMPLKKIPKRISDIAQIYAEERK
ncbi:MAG: hypothetical protein QXO35_03825 [Candidatus Micrarchaeia archaeon]